MKTKTSRRLRLGVLAMVTVLVASLIASAVALAEGDDESSLAGHGGGSSGKAYIDVTKTVVGGPAEANDFEVKLDGVTDYRAFNGGGSTGTCTFEVTQAGTYTVKEKAKENYTPNHGPVSVTFDDGDMRNHARESVSFTNTYTPPPKAYIEVIKTVVGGQDGADAFEVRLGNGSYHHFSGGKYTFEVDKTGTYTVTEKDKEDYTADPKTQSVEVLILENQTISVGITNTYVEPNKGHIHVSKTIVPAGSADYGDFKVALYKKYGGALVAGPVAFDASGYADFDVTDEGSYRVKEVTVAANFVPDHESQDVSFSDDDIDDGVTKNVSFTNTYKDPPGTGCITVEKQVVGDDGGSGTFHIVIRNAAGEIKGEADLADGQSFTKRGLPVGQYKIEESNPGVQWEVTYSPSNIVNLGGSSLACETTEPPKPPSAHVTVTNTLKPGSILVHKTITGKQDLNDPDSPDDFSVTLMKNGQVIGQAPFVNGYAEFSGLDPGPYTVVENQPGSEWNVTVQNGGAVTVENGVQATVEVTNERRLGSLLVTKTINGNNPQNLGFEDFDVVITGPSPGTIVFNGSFDKEGKILVEELLPGWYTVTEEALGYPWTIEGNGPVEVIAGQDPTVWEIINTGSTTTISLSTATSDPGTGTTLPGTTRTTLRTTATSSPGTGTTLPGTTQTTLGTTTRTTVLAFTSTPSTVLGWVAQANIVQTGGGGTAGWNWGAIIILVISSTMLVAVLTASAVGVHRGVL